MKNEEKRREGEVVVAVVRSREMMCDTRLDTINTGKNQHEVENPSED